jgi:hypothetical protein
MAASNPVRLTVDYEDGTKETLSFSALPLTLQAELMRQPAFSRPSADPENENFILMEWEDGWKEVIRVDADCTDINRYYVISRPEDCGRLSLNRKNGYPELIEINRKPLELKKIHFMGSFGLHLKKSVREGKKTDHFFALEKAEPVLSELLARFKAIVKQEGMDLSHLKNPTSGQENEDYRKIWQGLGIVAGQRQQDVIDIINCLAVIANEVQKKGGNHDSV